MMVIAAARCSRARHDEQHHEQLDQGHAAAVHEGFRANVCAALPYGLRSSLER